MLLRRKIFYNHYIKGKTIDELEKEMGCNKSDIDRLLGDQELLFVNEVNRKRKLEHKTISQSITEISDKLHIDRDLLLSFMVKYSK